MRPIIILGLLCALTAGCGGSGHASGKKSVVAAFYPLAFAAQTIGGDKVDVVNLTPAGAEPHDLEVTPSAVRELRSAELVLLLGHGFQPQLEKAAGTGGKVVLLLDTPGLRRYQNGDPHVWLDPVRYSLIVMQIGQALRGRAGAPPL